MREESAEAVERCSLAMAGTGSTTCMGGVKSLEGEGVKSLKVEHWRYWQHMGAVKSLEVG